jgi:hypothetical protein
MISKRIKIEAGDPSIHGDVNITNAETGERIPMVYRVEYVAEVGASPTIKLYAWAGQVEATAFGDIYERVAACHCWWCRAKNRLTNLVRRNKCGN